MSNLISPDLVRLDVALGATKVDVIGAVAAVVALKSTSSRDTDLVTL